MATRLSISVANSAALCVCVGYLRTLIRHGSLDRMERVAGGGAAGVIVPLLLACIAKAPDDSAKHCGFDEAVVRPVMDLVTKDDTVWKKHDTLRSRLGWLDRLRVALDAVLPADEEKVYGRDIGGAMRRSGVGFVVASGQWIEERAVRNSVVVGGIGAVDADPNARPAAVRSNNPYHVYAVRLMDAETFPQYVNRVTLVESLCDTTGMRGVSFFDPASGSKMTALRGDSRAVDAAAMCGVVDRGVRLIVVCDDAERKEGSVARLDWGSRELQYQGLLSNCGAYGCAERVQKALVMQPGVDHIDPDVAMLCVQLGCIFACFDMNWTDYEDATFGVGPHSMAVRMAEDAKEVARSGTALP